MGFDPPKQGETHQVCVELDGDCSKEDFEKYKQALRKCLQELAKFKAKRGSVRIVKRVEPSYPPPKAPEAP